MTKKEWTYEQIAALYDTPFIDLIFKAHQIHREHFKSDEIQVSTLLSIKTGTCPEDCTYCPQSAHYDTDIKKEKLLPLDQVIEAAHRAKEQGATRFCLGAAWRSPPKKEFKKVLTMVQEIKKMGMEACVTLGMLNQEEARELQAAGLDYYNHNLDTSPEYYEKIITTRTYQDRLDTLDCVRNAGIHVCCGGIMGLGESRSDRINFLLQLASLPEPPKSIPINQLVAVKGTPLENNAALDSLEFIRTIAIARILFPKSFVRLSAGRVSLSEEAHALCFMAGANSIFTGEVLLTTPLPDTLQDSALLNKLGLKITKNIDEYAH